MIKIFPAKRLLKATAHKVKSNAEGSLHGKFSHKRGAKYGVEEVTNPRRVITTTVKLSGSYLNLLPVKTNDSVPKELMFDIMKVLDKVCVGAPVNVGDVIVKDILGTGVDIVSSKSMESMNTSDKNSDHELRDCI